MESAAYRMVSLQAAVAILSAVLVFFLMGPLAAKAAFYGAMAALANTVFLLWRMRQGGQTPHLDAHRHLRMFYRSSLERFFVVGLLLAAGMGPLELLPLAVLGGFVLGQAALVVSQLTMRGMK